MNFVLKIALAHLYMYSINEAMINLTSCTTELVGNPTHPKLDIIQSIQTLESGLCMLLVTVEVKII